MFSGRKIVFKFLRLNLILSIVLFSVSLFMLSNVMDALDTGEKMGLFRTVIVEVGGILSQYFVLPIFFLPRSIQSSVIGCIASYVSIYMMTIPITAMALLIIKRLKHKKPSDNSPRTYI
jgi:hypothetical protein